MSKLNFFDSNEIISQRDAYARIITEIGQEHSNVIMLDADLSKSTKTGEFSKRYKERHFNIGIAEQNMVGIAAGFATMKYVPFVNTFAAFLTRRACDQIAISVAYPKLNVKFFGFHSGINLGEDGATQQAVEDIAIMRGIPNIQVYSPIDANDLMLVCNNILEYDGPTYVRLSRFPSQNLIDVSVQENTVPPFRVLREDVNPQVVIVTTGTLSANVMADVNNMVETGIRVCIIAVTKIKPLDNKVAEFLNNISEVPIVVVEEHSIHGGLADAISCLMDKNGYAHTLTRVGIQDRFGESGAPKALLESFGLSGKLLVDKIFSVIKN